MRIVKVLLAILLLPVVFFGLIETGRILLGVGGNFYVAFPFLLGVCVYAGLHYAVYDFSRPYVFIHEMTHALAAFLCGSRIKAMHVGRESGYVKMDKTNAFVVLAPYFIPGYVLLVAFIYMVLGLFVEVEPYRPAFLFGVGFFTSFHFIQTFKTLFEAQQSDLTLAGGKIFSVVMISLANLVVLAVVLKGLFPQQVSLLLAGKNVIRGTLNVGRILVNYIIEYFIQAG